MLSRLSNRRCQKLLERVTYLVTNWRSAWDEEPFLPLHRRRIAMPRRKMASDEKMLLLQGWETFGLWLRQQRIVKGFTQEEAARAVRISTRQWMRYEQGSRVVSKRYPSIAKALNIPLARILYLTGHEIAPRRNDANVRLRRIHDMLRAGSLDSALVEFLNLYDRIRPADSEITSNWDGRTAPDFATTVMLLDKLPKWLFEVITKCMQKRFSERQVQRRSDHDLRSLIVTECIDEVHRKVFALRVMLRFPESD